jgi:hypothetical protein
MTRRRWLAFAAVLIAGAMLPGAIGRAQRETRAQPAAPPSYPLSDELRTRLVSALDLQYGNGDRGLPPLDFGALAAALEKEFERSPSLFTLLDHGLMLEARKSARERKSRPMPPDIWSDPSFTLLRRKLERYGASPPEPASSLPRRAWWVDGADQPASFVNSRRKPIVLAMASPSLFRSDVDVFAFAGVPFLTRERMRLGAGATSEPFVYSSPFEPQITFPTLAPLLGTLAPFVEMMKVQGGLAEVGFDRPRVIQGVTDEWSAILDTGSGTFIGENGYWPVFAITSRGLVRGALTKVVAEGTHCSSGDGRDDFYAQFTFGRPLPTATYAIVQTGVPFDPTKARITTARPLTWFARPTYDYGLWYADLNADGIQDIAVAVGGVAMNSGDYFLGYVYANVNGRWKVLFVPDISGCT